MMVLLVVLCVVELSSPRLLLVAVGTICHLMGRRDNVGCWQGSKELWASSGSKIDSGGFRFAVVRGASLSVFV